MQQTTPLLFTAEFVNKFNYANCLLVLQSLLSLISERQLLVLEGKLYCLEYVIEMYLSYVHYLHT